MKNVALVGCGRMGVFTSENVKMYAPQCWLPLSHIDAAIAHPDLNVIALADKNSETLRKAAEYSGITTVHADLESLVSNHVIDVLCVATRTPGRADLIKKAYELDITAIHAEKPLCNTAKELKMLTEMLKHDNHYFTWGAIRRYMQAYLQALEMVNSGDHGQLREINVKFGSASLFWTHAHAFDLLLFGAGARHLVYVQAQLKDCCLDRKKQTAIVNDPVIKYCIAEFEDGLMGYITQSLGSDLVFTCEKAEISVQADGAELIIRKLDESGYAKPHRVEIKKSENEFGTLAPLSLLLGCLLGNTEDINENKKIKRDVIRAQWMMFASAISHLQGNRKVYFSETLPNIEIWAENNGHYA